MMRKRNVTFTTMNPRTRQQFKVMKVVDELVLSNDGKRISGIKNEMLKMQEAYNNKTSDCVVIGYSVVE